MTTKPPELCPIAQCDNTLDFQPSTAWPLGLPAVAVNHFVLAGFNQSLVFNHEIKDAAEIASLFRSFYFELSVPELARLWNQSQKQSLKWFPIAEVVGKFHLNYNENLENIFKAVLTLPSNVQKFCSEKKWGVQDFAPLLISDKQNLNPFWVACLDKKLSKSLSAQGLELFIDLLKLGNDSKTLLPTANDSAESWLESLKQKRFPETYQKDQLAQESLSKLPFPRSSHVRWVRQGDKSGLELKMFLSNPSDVRKQIESLQSLQEAFEKSPGTFWTKH